MSKHRHNIKGLPYVVLDNDGWLQLYTHDGHLVKPNVFIRLQDNMNGRNTVIAKFECNIVGSFEEMQDQIKEYENSTP